MEVDVVMSHSVTDESVRKKAIFRIIYCKGKRWGEKGALVFVRMETTPKITSPLAYG